MSKDTGYYPSGPINQHKALATGASLESCNTSDKETVPSPWGKGQKATEGRTNIKSGTSTGSPGSGRTVSHKVTPP